MHAQKLRTCLHAALANLPADANPATVAAELMKLQRTPEQIRARRFAGWVDGVNVLSRPYVLEGAIDAGYPADEAERIADAVMAEQEERTPRAPDELLTVLRSFSLTEA